MREFPQFFASLIGPLKSYDGAMNESDWLKIHMSGAQRGDTLEIMGPFWPLIDGLVYFFRLFILVYFFRLVHARECVARVDRLPRTNRFSEL